MKTSKKAFLGIILIALNFNILAQVGIGTSNPHASAALEIQSTSKGFLFPRMTEVARDAISNIATGLTIYCTDCSTSGGGVLQVYNGSNWEDLNDFVSASTGGMFTEKVGIGTIGTTPIYALDVDANNKGSSTYSARFTNSATENDLYNIVLFTQGQSGSAEGYLGTGGSNVTNPAFRDNFVVGTKSNSPLVLNTNDTEKMRIDALGNVGIGTSDPTQTLDVNGSIRSRKQGFKLADDTTTAGLLIMHKNVTGSGTDRLPVLFAETGNQLSFMTNGHAEERMVIDTLGHVGIGTSSPSKPLEITDATSDGTGGVKISSYLPTLEMDDISGGGTSFILQQDGANTLFKHDTAERARIDSSGRLLHQTTSSTSYPTASVYSMFGVSGDVTLKLGGYGGAHTMVQFLFAGNNSVGKIISSATSTSYNTSSDQRLKENIADADDAGSKIDAIQVRKYDWKVDGSHQDYGMIAQELQAVAPEAVCGDADSEEMMGVDYSKLVPMLIKEIQSLRSRVAQLEN